MHLHRLSHLGSLAVAFALCTAALAAAESPLGILVTEVADQRSTGGTPAECRITLALAGDAATDAHSVRRIRLTRAIDELERDLIKVAEQNQAVLHAPVAPTLDELQRLNAVADEVARRRALREEAQATMQAARPTPRGAPVMTARDASVPLVESPEPRNPPRPVPAVSPTPMAIADAPMPLPMNPGSTGRPVLRLHSPSRQSQTIKLIEGEIELFTPTEANGGLVRIPDLAARAGTFLTHPGLEPAKLRAMYVTPEILDSVLLAGDERSTEDRASWRADLAQAKRRFPTLAETRVKWAFVVMPDPENKVVALELEEKSGNPLHRRPAHRVGSVHVFTLAAPLPGDAELVIRLATDGSLTRHPFKLENIALP